MLVRQKLKLYEEGKLSHMSIESYSSADKKTLNSKLEGVLENYLWKYVDKLDDTLEIASDKIIEQLDKHIMKERKKGKSEKKEKK